MNKSEAKKALLSGDDHSDSDDNSQQPRVVAHDSDSEHTRRQPQQQQQQQATHTVHMSPTTSPNRPSHAGSLTEAVTETRDTPRRSRMTSQQTTQAGTVTKIDSPSIGAPSEGASSLDGDLDPDPDPDPNGVEATPRQLGATKSGRSIPLPPVESDSTQDVDVRTDSVTPVPLEAARIKSAPTPKRLNSMDFTTQIGPLQTGVDGIAREDQMAALLRNSESHELAHQMSVNNALMFQVVLLLKKLQQQQQTPSKLAPLALASLHEQGVPNMKNAQKYEHAFEVYSRKDVKDQINKLKKKSFGDKDDMKEKDPKGDKQGKDKKQQHKEKDEVITDDEQKQESFYPPVPKLYLEKDKKKQGGGGGKKNVESDGKNGKDKKKSGKGSDGGGGGVPIFYFHWDKTRRVVFLDMKIKKIRQIDVRNESFRCHFHFYFTWLATVAEYISYKTCENQENWVPSWIPEIEFPNVNAGDQDSYFQPRPTSKYSIKSGEKYTWEHEVAGQSIFGKAIKGNMSYELDPRQAFWIRCQYEFDAEFAEEFELHSYPFDCQDLTIEMRSTQKTSECIILPFPRNGAFCDFNPKYSVLDDFQVDNVLVEFSMYESSKNHAKKSHIHIRVKCKRNWWSTWFELVLVFALTLLSLGAFAIDASENMGERLGYLVTLLLADVAMQQLVSSQTPQIPYTTFMDKMIFGSFSFICLAMIWTVFLRIPEWNAADAWMALVSGILFTLMYLFFVWEAWRIRTVIELPKLKLQTDGLRSLLENEHKIEAQGIHHNVWNVRDHVGNLGPHEIFGGDIQTALCVESKKVEGEDD